MDYLIDPATKDWAVFDIGAEEPARRVGDLLPEGYTSAYSVDLAEFPVGGYSAPHVDNGHLLYIVTGTAEMVIGEETVIATSGMLVAVPKGVPHSTRNIADEPLLLLTIYDPPRSHAPKK